MSARSILAGLTGQILLKSLANTHEHNSLEREVVASQLVYLYLNEKQTATLLFKMPSSHTAPMKIHIAAFHTFSRGGIRASWRLRRHELGAS